MISIINKVEIKWEKQQILIIKNSVKQDTIHQFRLKNLTKQDN